MITSDRLYNKQVTTEIMWQNELHGLLGVETGEGSAAGT